MNRVRSIFARYHTSAVLLLLAFAVLVASFAIKRFAVNPERVASGVERQLSLRLDKLEKLAARAAVPDSASWLEADGVAGDMVIYRYVDDTLQSWVNLFPLGNDDLRAKVSYQQINRPEYNSVSPLLSVGEEWQFMSLGPKWYMLRSFSSGYKVRVIAGLEICSEESGGRIVDINEHLHIPRQYDVAPITGNLGYEVRVDGCAKFVISRNTNEITKVFSNSGLRWAGLALLCLAALAFLWRRRNLTSFFSTVLLLSMLLAFALVWGHQIQHISKLFSPSVYAGGPVWSSFGALILQNMYVVAVAISVFLVRRPLMRIVIRAGRWAQLLYAALAFAIAAALVTYSIISLRDLILNSSITLSLPWVGSGAMFSLLTVVVYTALIGASLLLLRMAVPMAWRLAGRKARSFSYGHIAVVAVVFTAVFFSISETIGFQKERSRVQVWSNRLAVDRNLSLELELRSIEETIAADGFIPMVASLPDAENIIRNRVADTYFYRVSNEYDITVSLCTHDDLECEMLFARRMEGGTLIAPDSHFVCLYNNNGHSDYAGLFLYQVQNGALVRMLVELSSRANREESGYYSILASLPSFGSVRVPDRYSYAKYIDGKLVSYRGTYIYPTVIDGKYVETADAQKSYFLLKKSIHFTTRVDDNEIIVISRPRKSGLMVISSILAILTLMLLLLAPLAIRRRRTSAGRGGFRRRITVIMTVAISASLAGIAAVSIKFVFDRNRADTYDMMSSKISTIQTLVESRTQDVADYSALGTQEFRNALMEIAANTKSDISLYTSDGLVFMSTVSEVFERMLISPRINGRAFDEVVRKHNRVSIIREEFEGRRYYALYAPVFNRDDEMVAIVSSPYSERSNVMREAVPHAVLLLIIALTLLLVFTAISERIIDMVFSPLSEVGRKMSAARTKGLEYIDYPHDDELTSLIQSYNSMVGDLEESTRILAQTERDKAWSEMARQVAHEIKNPLTPMKLTIQRLIRMKNRSDSTFGERFDELSGVILEQIDILTETANEFSTFAKLYSEDPVEMDLDTLLKEQVTLFDNRENVEISYIGMRDALISGPKPQLIRVFVNLISNALQAVEAVQDARINVLLRTAAKDGFYEVVVEDNGPGVGEENVEKLFTPNFTTKSSGTGLGLAISRNIIQKCGGEISYRKSYALGGAAFSVLLKKL